MADLLVVAPRADGETAEDQLRASVRPVIERLGLDEKRFEVNDDGTGGRVSAKDKFTAGKDAGLSHGDYLLFAMIGADPLNLASRFHEVRTEGGGRAVVSQAGGVLLVETVRKTGLDMA
ncbi:hypothetical protein M2271_005402, partial [Streptomyces sp. LBL]|nr:hypothetical protein [Streptomyces sp. LBL]